MSIVKNLNKTALLSLIVLIGGTTLLPSAFAAKASNVNAAGSGSATCEGGPMGLLFPASIGFSASAGSGTISGSGKITYTTTGSEASLFILSGTITSSSYSLAGSVSFECLGPFGISVANGSFSVSGPCGAGVTITFTAFNGDHGTFTGNAACNK